MDPRFRHLFINFILDPPTKTHYSLTMNQSFTDFKLAKKKLEEEIIILCNTFSQEFGVKIELIYIQNYVHQVDEESPKILGLNVEVDI